MEANRIDTNHIADNSGFVDSSQPPTLIKVVGVGGGGNNAINHMYSQNIEGVSFVVINTDRQALNMSPVPNKLLIGPTVTRGLGAGNKPEKAREAAEESEAEIAALFDDETKMVFITAGMGGGTGTGAAPVVARIAQEKGVLTIGIVTIPFLFEGTRKILKALDGANEMGKYVDALLIINNQRLIDIYPDLDFNNAFGKADDTLSTAARSISELITAEGKINLDFNDVNTTLRKGGVAIISSGYGEGEHRVTAAIDDALESPLLKNRDVYGSQRILINVYFNPNDTNPFQMSEMDELSTFMANFSPEVEMIYGAAYDFSLENRIKITVLAAGFNVSLETETPKPAVTRQQGTRQAAPPQRDPTSRLREQYGDEQIKKMEQDKARAQFVILRPEDLDNDDVVNMLERTPTFKRKPESKAAIRDKQQAATGGQQPVTIPAAQQPAAQQPAPRNSTPAGEGSTQTTIHFGDE